MSALRRCNLSSLALAGSPFKRIRPGALAPAIQQLEDQFHELILSATTIVPWLTWHAAANPSDPILVGI